MITFIKEEKQDLQKELKKITSKYDKEKTVWESKEYNLKCKIRTLQASEASLGSELEMKESQNQKYSASVKNLELSIFAKNRGISTLQKEKETLNDEKIKLNKEIFNLKADISLWSIRASKEEKLRQDRESEIEILKSKVDFLNAEILELNEEILELNEEILELNEEIKDKNTEIAKKKRLATD